MPPQTVLSYANMHRLPGEDLETGMARFSQHVMRSYGGQAIPEAERGLGLRSPEKVQKQMLGLAGTLASPGAEVQKPMTMATRITKN